MRQGMIQNYNMNSVGVQPADFVIAPDVTSFDLSEFTVRRRNGDYCREHDQCIGPATQEHALQAGREAVYVTRPSFRRSSVRYAPRLQDAFASSSRDRCTSPAAMQQEQTGRRRR